VIRLIGGAFVIAGCVAGVIGIVMAVRHDESEDVSKWIAAGIALLAIGTLVSSL
jgi:Ca2+/Na+ antiporter